MKIEALKPVEFGVLIQVDDVDDKSMGGLFLPETAIEREQLGHDRGVLVCKSDMAFDDWNGTIPRVGDRVIFKKYAGTVIQHKEDRKLLGKYRLCKDKDIVAVIREDES